MNIINCFKLRNILGILVFMFLVYLVNHVVAQKTLKANVIGSSVFGYSVNGYFENTAVFGGYPLVVIPSSEFKCHDWNVLETDHDGDGIDLRTELLDSLGQEIVIDSAGDGYAIAASPILKGSFYNVNCRLTEDLDAPGNRCSIYSSGPFGATAPGGFNYVTAYRMEELEAYSGDNNGFRADMIGTILLVDFTLHSPAASVISNARASLIIRHPDNNPTKWEMIIESDFVSREQMQEQLLGKGRPLHGYEDGFYFCTRLEGNYTSGQEPTILEENRGRS